MSGLMGVPQKMDSLLSLNLVLSLKKIFSDYRRYLN